MGWALDLETGAGGASGDMCKKLVFLFLILIEKLMGMSKSLHASKNFWSSWPFHILMIKPTVVTSLVYPPMRIYLNRSI